MLKVSQTTLPGVLKIERRLFQDHRGLYGEIYQKREYFDAGIRIDFVEQNFSFSRRNVLRGLHGDSKTWKLICCPYGMLCLVVLDYREKSKTFGQWERFTLTPNNGLQILVPPRFANGHLILSDWAMFHYNQSEYYSGASDQFTVKWSDSRFNIKWPLDGPPTLSERDGGAK